MRYLAFAGIAIFGVTMLAVNVAFYRHRRKMTPTQRAEQDEKIAAGIQQW